MLRPCLDLLRANRMLDNTCFSCHLESLQTQTKLAKNLGINYNAQLNIYKRNSDTLC